MTTALYELSYSIPDRLFELVTLTDTARDVQDSDEALYNAICRSCCVLLASHLEGYLKELKRSIISDLNDNAKGFAQLPTAVQRTFCLKIAEYDGVPSKEIEARVRQLMTFFTKNSVNVDMSAFPYNENVNRNPSGSFIDQSLEKIGVPSILNILDMPSLTSVFQNDDRVSYLLNRKLRSLTCKFHSYPFHPLPKAYRPVRAGKANRSSGQSIWYTFVEDMMIRRHNVAHGDTLSNDTSWEDLKQDTDKLRVLFYGLTFAVGGFLVQRTP